MNNHVFRFFKTIFLGHSPHMAVMAVIKLAGPWLTPGSAQTGHERYLGPEFQRIKHGSNMDDLSDDFIHFHHEIREFLGIDVGSIEQTDSRD